MSVASSSPDRGTIIRCCNPQSESLPSLNQESAQLTNITAICKTLFSQNHQVKHPPTLPTVFATKGLGVSDFVYRIIRLRGFRHGFGAQI